MIDGGLLGGENGLHQRRGEMAIEPRGEPRVTRGVDAVATMQSTWEAMKPFVDVARFEQIKAFLAIQREEAQWWRDACIAYFQSLNKLPLPAGFAPPKHPLEYYKSLKFPYAPGRG